MLDGQFELDGYTFGHPTDDVVVLTDGWDTGKYSHRVQDVVMPAGDRIAFGRDYLTPGSWTFQLGVRDNGVTVLEKLAVLANAWRADSIRLSPSKVSTLKYRRDGQERVVYGRPRDFAVEPDQVWSNDWKVVTCTFQLADTLTYGANLNTLELDLLNTSSATGLIFPETFPWQFRSSDMTREGLLTVTSASATPFKVVISGPITGEASSFKLASTGWEMSFATTLAPGGDITVDTMLGTATRNGSAFGVGTVLTNYKAKLVPGPQEIVFTAQDPSYTSRATLTWRDVSPTI